MLNSLKINEEILIKSGKECKNNFMFFFNYEEIQRKSTMKMYFTFMLEKVYFYL